MPLDGEEPRPGVTLPDAAQAGDRCNKANLRIDNRAKEFAIGELNRRLNEDRDKFVSAMQDMSYKLGAAETRLAQIEAPKADNAARQSTPERDTESVVPVILPTSAPIPEEPAPAAPTETPAPEPEPRRSFFGRLFP